MTWLFLHWIVLTAIGKFPILREVEYIKDKKEASRAARGFSYHSGIRLRPLFYQAGLGTLFPSADRLVSPHRRRVPFSSHCRSEWAQQECLDCCGLYSGNLGSRRSFAPSRQKKGPKGRVGLDFNRVLKNLVSAGQRASQARCAIT
jgi:hypothetical protein